MSCVGTPSAPAWRCNVILKNLFPRLFGQFREGGIIHAKFVVSGGGSVYTLKTAVGTQNYQSLSLANTATGKMTLTLAGAARAIALLEAMHVNVAAPATASAYLDVNMAAAINEGAGTLQFATINKVATPALANPANTDELHFTLYVDR